MMTVSIASIGRSIPWQCLTRKVVSPQNAKKLPALVHSMNISTALGKRYKNCFISIFCITNVDIISLYHENFVNFEKIVVDYSCSG